MPEIGDTMELRIQLRDMKPEVWRGLLVPADVPLGILHEIIQVAFGWQNRHPHDFTVGDICFGIVDEDEDENELLCVDEYAAPLGAVARLGTVFRYRYDFGDDWEHDVTVKGITSDGDDAFKCIGGARSSPPEDCGGAPGYERMLQILADPTHDEHRDMKKWVGKDFDPEKLDLPAVNKELSALLKRLQQAD